MSREGLQKDQRAGTPVLHEQFEGFGSVQPGGEMASGAALQYLKRAYRKYGEGLIIRAFGGRTRGNGFQKDQDRFRLNKRKTFFTMGAGTLECVTQRSGVCLIPSV